MDNIATTTRHAIAGLASVGGFDREPDPCSTLKRIVGGRQMPNLSEVPVGSWLRQAASGAGITGQPNGVHSLFLTPTFRLPQFGVLVMMTNRRYYLLCDLRSQNRLTRSQEK